MVPVVKTEAVGPVGLRVGVVAVNGVIAGTERLPGAEGEVGDPNAADEILIFFVLDFEVQVCHLIMFPVGQLYYFLFIKT